MESIQLQTIVTVIENELLIQITSRADMIIERRLTFKGGSVGWSRVKAEVRKAFRQALDIRIEED